MDNPFEVINKELQDIKNLLTELKQQNIKPLPVVEETPKDVKEAAAFLKRKEQKVYILTSRREITFAKKGKKILFFQRDLLNYLNSGKHKSRKEIEESVENHLGQLGERKLQT